MSVQTIAWVLEHSPTKGAARLVMIAVANYADDAGWAWPSHRTIARLANIGDATAKRTLSQLVDDGHLQRKVNAAPDDRIPKDRRPNLYRVVMGEADGGHGSVPPRGAPLMPDGGHNDDATGGTVDAPKPSPDPSVEPSASARDDARAQFDDYFWPSYPSRNGRKIGKADALAQWVKLSIDDRRAALRGARIMAVDVNAGRALPPDAHRWLRKRTWEDWQTPPDPTAAPQRRGQQTLGEKTDIIIRGTQLAADAGLIDDDEPRQEPLRELA